MRRNLESEIFLKSYVSSSFNFIRLSFNLQALLPLLCVSLNQPARPESPESSGAFLFSQGGSDAKPREQKVFSVVFAEERSSSAPNWCSDQRTAVRWSRCSQQRTSSWECQGATRYPSWLMTSCFDPRPSCEP